MDEATVRETTTLDKLFLELSQFTQATTARESQLPADRHSLLGELAKAKIAGDAAYADGQRDGMERAAEIAIDVNRWGNGSDGAFIAAQVKIRDEIRQAAGAIKKTGE